jgi:hypothetical protein
MAIKMAKKAKSANGVTFTFADKAATQMAFELSELSAAMITELAIHGLSQKVGDSYSGAETVSEGMELAKATWKNLLAGNFNARASGGGLLAEAVARIKGISIADAEAKLADATEEQIETLRKNSKVKDTITIIRGERAAAKATTPDADDLEI